MKVLCILLVAAALLAIGGVEDSPDNVSTLEVSRSEHVLSSNRMVQTYSRGGRRILAETFERNADGQYVLQTRSYRGPDGWTVAESDEDSDGRCDTLLVYSQDRRRFEAFSRSWPGGVERVEPLSAEDYAALLRKLKSLPYPLGTGTNTEFQIPAFQDATQK